MDINKIPEGYDGRMTPAELRAWTERLLSDRLFLDVYTCTQREPTPLARRETIKHALNRLGFRPGTRIGVSVADREQIRLALDEHLRMPPAVGVNARCRDRRLSFMTDPVHWADAQPEESTAPGTQTGAVSLTKTAPPTSEELLTLIESTVKSLDRPRIWIDEASYIDPTLWAKLTPKPKETTMNTKPITVTTQTLINGRTADAFSKPELYDLIAREEDQIRKLETIENKPVSLVNEIARRKQGITDLVAYLDSQEQPQQDQAQPSLI